MKYIFAALALAGTISASPLHSRQVQQQYVDSFAASCTAHATTCNVNFTITDNNPRWLSQCGAWVSSPDGVHIPDIKEGQCQNNPAWTWELHRLQDGSVDFAIWFPLDSRSNITYLQNFPASDFVIQNDLSVSNEKYVGPSSFSPAWDQSKSGYGNYPKDGSQPGGGSSSSGSGGSGGGIGVNPPTKCRSKKN